MVQGAASAAAAATADVFGQGPRGLVRFAGDRGIGSGGSTSGRTAASARGNAWCGRVGGGTAGPVADGGVDPVAVGGGGVASGSAGTWDVAGCVACVESGGVPQ